jgi:hypothetical protein
MDTLRASVDQAKGPKDRGREKAASTGAPPARIKDAADKRRTGKTAKAKQTKASSFDSLTKAELYQRATDAGIPGRSSMTRESSSRPSAAAGADARLTHPEACGAVQGSPGAQLLVGLC